MNKKELLFNRVRNVISAIGLPFYSIFSYKVPFCLFFRFPSGWKAFIYGRLINVYAPRIQALEYFRYFIPDRGSTVIDIGGELGHEAIQLSTLVGEKGKVYVFECFPEHIKKLKIRISNTNNIELIENAVWNENTKIKLFSGYTPGSNTLISDALGQYGQDLADINKRKYTVSAVTLDSFWKDKANSRKIDFLKMDIEGAEIEAIEGAQETLRNTNKVVIAAYHIRDGQRTAIRVAESLKKLYFNVKIDENYHIYATRENDI